ncbi:hypothetical protein SLEP1_g33968 [Rubroshorea leprosula]|uniref:Plastid division protein PDV2 n=1 Tax=Rubroshorea leprosula TaxID=152421 RepID=A0AAV5KIA9_9ROSI|nr:hypothetical protein SLEP1_g33968 [Rubroshorea leprosula]
MEDEGVGLVLARATELRLKISHCIEKATAGNTPSSTDGTPEGRQQQEEGDGESRKKDGVFDAEKNPKPDFSGSLGDVDEEDDDGETPRLLNIRDALESLESQLVALQNLQQQQCYEREVALAEIDYSRKILLEKLKDYDGKDLEVIHEASAFAGETVENNSNLLLPPYPSRPPRPLVLDSDYLSHLKSTSKSAPNGVNTNGSTNETKKHGNRYERNEKQTESNNSRKGLGSLLITAFKTVLPLVAVIYALSSSNITPNFGKKIAPLKSAEEKKATIRCPPGKVLVMEGGEARCLVKERVEVPFESIIAKPDVNYGCG